ncbi:MAG TPA: hypothetical protein ENI60_08005 [Candidatus Fraserbacteria bacterium]|nr:hypothetical protein [Candidatus Fraserbacteria bacterium]
MAISVNHTITEDGQDIIGPAMSTGITNPRILLDGGALAILERDVALWHGGLTLRDLSQTIARLL